MSVNLAPGPFGVGGQFFSGNTPLNGGLIYTYAAGTTTPLATYTTSTGSTPNANPIVLSANGIAPQEMWLTAGFAYKFLVTDSVGNVIYPYTMDNITGINDFSAIPSTQEWIPTGLTPTFASTTSFTLTGDQTAIFTPKRRIKVTETAGTVYGFVTSSSVLALVTTVNVTMDGGAVIDSGLSSVSYGILNAVNVSIPQIILAGTGVTVVYVNGIPTISAAGIVRGAIDGFIMSPAGGATSMPVSGGQATDSTNTIYIAGAATTKTQATFAAGTGNGGKLSAAAIVNNTWYRFYAISNAGGTNFDVGFDISPTTPTLPTGFTTFREIGSGLTDGSGNWVKYIQTDDYFERDVPTNDVNTTNPGTTAVLRTISTPLGVRVRAKLANAESDTTSNRIVFWSDPNQTDTTPSTPPFTFNILAVANSYYAGGMIEIYTNLLSQIRYRSSASGASDATIASVLGYYDSRGRNK